MSRSSNSKAAAPYNMVIDGVHLRCVGLVDAVVLGMVDTEHHGLLEDPSSNVPRQLRVSGRDTIWERLPGILVAKELDAAREDDARVLGGLEASHEAKLATGPETLAALFCSVHEDAGTRVVGRVGCEAGRGCAEDGDQVRAISERVWGTREPDRRGACRENG